MSLASFTLLCSLLTLSHPHGSQGLLTSPKQLAEQLCENAKTLDSLLPKLITPMKMLSNELAPLDSHRTKRQGVNASTTSPGTVTTANLVFIRDSILTPFIVSFDLLMITSPLMYTSMNAYILLAALVLRTLFAIVRGLINYAEAVGFSINFGQSLRNMANRLSPN